jgi:predicted secreted protein
MGNRPEIIVAPLALAELSQQAARLQAAFESSGINQFVSETKNKLEQIQKLISPAIEQIVKAGKLIKEQVNKVKNLFKPRFVKYIPLELPLFKIPRAQIQPSTGKDLQLPNSYRSHSPPFYSVIV